eukprot:Em0007g839a
MSGNITFVSVNHSIPEPNKYFYVMLTASNGGSQISSQGNVVQVIELKGNNANGIFGFASNLPTNISEPGNLSLTVTGQGGTFDTVTLTWMIAVPAVQGVPVIYDFVANTSQVVFPPGVSQATLTISTFHDGIPSLTRSSCLWHPATDWSALLPRAELATTFNTTVLPPPGTLIPPATSPPIISVDKSNHTTIMVYVARAMGHVGTIDVEYYTYSGTASSSSATPDYVSTGGSLTFSPTDQVMAFPVIILDNRIPELWKSFYVGLANPSGVRRGGPQGNASESWFVVEQTPDITPAVGMVTFTAGQTSAQFVISAVDDMTPEFQEVFHLMLANATDGSSLNSSGLLLANISIPANHYQCGLFVFDAMHRSLVVNYTVESVELVGCKQRVRHGWQCGIATTGVDYVPTSGVNMTTRKIAGIPHQLTLLSGFMCSSVKAVTSNSDCWNGVEFGRCCILIRSSCPCQCKQASRSSATPDYVSTGGSLTFSPTDQVMAFPVIILDNQIPELWKSFYVGLANPSGDLGLGSPLTITIRLIDHCTNWPYIKLPLPVEIVLTST